VGIAAWVFRRKRMHSLMRMALLTSFLAYACGLLLLGIDAGRPWNFYWIVFPWRWNMHSPLAEVAICMSIYAMIPLTVENIPPVLERLWYFDSRLRPVVEGSIPARDDGIYMQLGGKPAIQVVKEVAAQAAAVIAIGSCASWGGVPSADPNPTGAVGVDSVISGKPIVNLPGCPPNPYNLLAVVLEYVTMGRLPELDQYCRPKFAYDRVIHENCPRRAHFDAGRFAAAFGDEGHRKGYCLYKLGCKGPVTHAACATRHFNEIPGVWPIGVGAPCMGCTEKGVVWQMGTFETVPIHLATPPETYPPIFSSAGQLKVGAATLVGAIAGAVGGATWVASQRFHSSMEAGVTRIAADRDQNVLSDIVLDGGAQCGFRLGAGGSH